MATMKLGKKWKESSIHWRDSNPSPSLNISLSLNIVCVCVCVYVCVKALSLSPDNKHQFCEIFQLIFNICWVHTYTVSCFFEHFTQTFDNSLDLCHYWLIMMNYKCDFFDDMFIPITNQQTFCDISDGRIWLKWLDAKDRKIWVKMCPLLTLLSLQKDEYANCCQAWSSLPLSPFSFCLYLSIYLSILLFLPLSLFSNPTTNSLLSLPPTSLFQT